MKKISLSVVCPMASCTRSNTCARYAQYVKALTCADTFEVLNVKHLQCEGEKCPYHLVSEKQVWARGFQRIYSTIPAGRTHYFYSRTPYARRRFYKAKNGEIAIDPDMQQHLLSIFREHGADMSIGFDSYEEKDVLVENKYHVDALLRIQFHRVLTGKGQLSVEIAKIRREFGLVVGRNEEIVA